MGKSTRLFRSGNLDGGYEPGFSVAGGWLAAGSLVLKDIVKKGGAAAEPQTNGSVGAPLDARVSNSQSPLALFRARSGPVTPLVFNGAVTLMAEMQVQELPAAVRDVFRASWPDGKASVLQIVQDETTFPLKLSRKPLRVGVAFARSPGSGGHNVVAGVWDHLQLRNMGSQVFAFRQGIAGVVNQDYLEISGELLDLVRNAGSNPHITVGNDQIKSEEDLAAALRTAKKLDLNGLVLVGGNQALSDAALLAEYFVAHGSRTSVIAVPKASSGDLCNKWVETPLGFDSAIRTYAEFVGNLETDLATSRKYYHLVRLLGERSSHVAVHVALETRPNFVAVGENYKGSPFTAVVEQLEDLVLRRAKLGKHYGIVLIAEGFLSYFPEWVRLIDDLNGMPPFAPRHGCSTPPSYEAVRLPPESKELWNTVPETVQRLLLRYQRRGILRASSFAVERLLAALLQRKLGSKFSPRCHVLAREGRAAFPSPFDADYAYTLGMTAAALIENEKSGRFAAVGRLNLSAEGWACRGVPLACICSGEKDGKPRVDRTAVDVHTADFQLFKHAMSVWACRDCYVSPGPVQYDGPTSQQGPVALKPLVLEDLVPDVGYNWIFRERRHYFARCDDQFSALQRARMNAPIPQPLVLRKAHRTIKECRRATFADPQTEACVSNFYTQQVRLHRSMVLELTAQEDPPDPASLPAEGVRVGVLLNGQQAAGVANVLVGLWDGLSTQMPRGFLLGFVGGVQGLLDKPPRVIELTRDDIAMCRNQGGFEVLGRQKEAELILATEEGLARAIEVVQELNLDSLVVIGGRHSITCGTLLTEEFLKRRLNCAVVVVPATQNNNINTTFLESCIGFDSSSKCYAALIGNLNADAVITRRHWNFVRLMGPDKSHLALETALSTHSHVTLVSEYFSHGHCTLEDVIRSLADAVDKRARAGKHFGTALVPEGLISSLPDFALLLAEMRWILTKFSGCSEKFNEIALELVDLKSEGLARTQLSPFAWSLWGSLPRYIRAQLVQPKDLGCVELSKVATEELVSELVERDLRRRVQEGTTPSYVLEKFAPHCYYYGYQCRGSLPSLFDCALGWAHGAIAAELAKAGRTGYVTAPRGLAARPREWLCRAVPCTALLRPRSVVMEQDIFPRPMPVVPGDMVRTSSAAMKAFLMMQAKWLRNDEVRCPGPIQFYNEAARELNELIMHDHQTYLEMLKRVNNALNHVRRACSNGASETVLRVSVGTLETLQRIAEAQASANP